MRRRKQRRLAPPVARTPEDIRRARRLVVAHDDTPISEAEAERWWRDEQLHARMMRAWAELVRSEGQGDDPDDERLDTHKAAFELGYRAGARDHEPEDQKASARAKTFISDDELDGFEQYRAEHPMTHLPPGGRAAAARRDYLAATVAGWKSYPKEQRDATCERLRSLVRRARDRRNKRGR